jgi:ornithine cyclodeaminase/alanine dehydrogenase-like protein (mu-crystallin family)
MDNDGKPVGFINAEELTAFRTALASSLLMSRRSKIKTVTVFGAGKQAYVPCHFLSPELLLTGLDTGIYASLCFFMGRLFVTCT